MPATIKRRNRLSPEHESLLGLLAGELRGGVLTVQTDGLYPGAGLRLEYSRHGVAVSRDVPAEITCEAEEHLLAHRLERALMRELIQRLWRG
jgi:hypothetical protein